MSEYEVITTVLAVITTATAIIAVILQARSHKNQRDKR
jgi:hypothetical protein